VLGEVAIGLAAFFLALVPHPFAKAGLKGSAILEKFSGNSAACWVGSASLDLVTKLEPNLQ
jgi:hypothetical protein